MGNASWATMSNRAAYATSTAAIAKSARHEIFREHAVYPPFHPANIKVRESVDSDANPNSTPIILGLDVTGSMGMIAEYIAKDGLGPLIESILETQAIPDPHIMAMAVGDIFCDRGPLQVTQFEADIRILEQLQKLWLESAGGGNGFESYDLPWLFAGLKTSIDSFRKRGKKGYIFTFGDEPPPPPSTVVSKAALDNLFGRGVVEKDYTSSEMLALAQKEWAVFHVIVEEGSHCRHSKHDVISRWTELLGPNVICLNDYRKLPQVTTAVLRVAEGADMDDVLAEAGDAKAAIAHAFGRT